MRGGLAADRLRLLISFFPDLLQVPLLSFCLLRVDNLPFHVKLKVNPFGGEFMLIIHCINPDFIDPKQRKRFFSGGSVPFFKGKIRMAKEQEISLMESTFNQKLDRQDGFIPAIFI